MNKKRYNTLDNLRGFAIINMVLYHTIWNLVYLFNINIDWFKTDVAYMWQQSICWTFIFLSGFCFNFSKHKLKNGLKTFLYGLIVSLVTIFLMPNNKIFFGVLTLIGSCMIIVNFLESTLNKIKDKTGFIFFFIMFIVTKNVNDGYLGISNISVFKLPKILYYNNLTAYLGFPAEYFKSSDYFSIIPWLFLFISGYYLNIFLLRKDFLKYFIGKKIGILSFLGKNSIKIYLIHQPIVYFILIILL